MSLRQNVRNFLLGATVEQVKQERTISLEMGDFERADYVDEFLTELLEEQNAD